jgi:hypothetical protein
MWETAKLTERVEALTRAIDKLGPAFERALEKHAADMKERVADIKSDAKESNKQVSGVTESIASFKGAMKVFGGIYALALVLVAAFLAWYLRPDTPAPSSPVPAPVTIAQPPQVSEAPAVPENNSN